MKSASTWALSTPGRSSVNSTVSRVIEPAPEPEPEPPAPRPRPRAPEPEPVPEPLERQPWSEPEPIFRVPELGKGRTSDRDPNTFCYAAKEHPQFSSGRRITFTYVCNLFTGREQDPMSILQRLQLDMRLYRPIPVTLELPSFE